jgi:RNA polymerase sigma factor (sigma-70 family)
MHLKSLAGFVSGSSVERAEAFERLTQSRLDRAYRLAVALLHEADEAEDAVIDAAEQAWRDWGALRDTDLFDAWFDRILVHRCMDRARRRRRVVPLSNLLEVARSDLDGTQAESDDALLRALDALSPDHRAAVVLRYVDDLSLTEIAIRTGARVGTVKSRLHYALRELRAAYEARQRLDGDRR